MVNKFARHLRKNMTVAEKILWSELRKLRARGYHFRRQSPVDDFIVDLTIHERVPGWANKAVPPALLQKLPPIRHPLEYRMVGGALVLWDVDAEILIDALPGAFTGE